MSGSSEGMWRKKVFCLASKSSEHRSVWWTRELVLAWPWVKEALIRELQTYRYASVAFCTTNPASNAGVESVAGPGGYETLRHRLVHGDYLSAEKCLYMTRECAAFRAATIARPAEYGITVQLNPDAPAPTEAEIYALQKAADEARPAGGGLSRRERLIAALGAELRRPAPVRFPHEGRSDRVYGGWS